VDEPVFLGLDSDTAVFAVDLSTVEETEALRLAGAGESVDTRAAFGELSAAQAATMAYARGLLHWHRNQRFCGACGAASAPRHGGHLRTCLGCGKLLFPRIEPAVIVLVTAGDRCLLGRHRGAAEGVFATLAGLVEIGESLEDAVRREVREEAGVRVREVSYQASQAWPFPAGLMVGFRATAVSDEVEVDRTELAEARWFTRAELRERLDRYRRQGISRYDSIEKYLLDTWLSQEPARQGQPARP
jgi:NAD+ diphosphatase